ncbi:hypothetical protein EN933_05425 [Mesorhizobium sp. M7A.F.Ca.US.001.01.1.1]|nr:hypothetical protein EN933_05425 [Mesorhizobium sp. M7A.F.Ca.US.001.01.1.1]
MLKHLKVDAERLKPDSVLDWGSATSGLGAEEVKFFPPSHMEPLLWEGFVRPGAKSEPNPFLRFNVRDQMNALLDGYGGCRHSEGLHFWVQDVVEEPGKPGHALVVINHPSESRVKFYDFVSGGEQIASRQEVLKRRYGIRPRHLVKRGRYHAGWKGMDLNKQHQAFIYWLDETAGALFWTLYLGYLRFVRGPIMEKRKALGGYDHPFLFVSEREPRGDDTHAMIGDPYSSAAHERNHKAAVLRIGLKHGKAYGTTTQGMRHAYGQTLRRLGVPPQVIKKGLHHRHYLSQVPYTVPTREEINAELNAAHARRNGVQMPVPQLEHETSRTLLKLHQFIVSGEVDV